MTAINNKNFTKWKELKNILQIHTNGYFTVIGFLKLKINTT